MSTTVTTNNHNQTAAPLAAPGEAHQKSKLTKAHIAMRIELRETIDTMTEAASSEKLTDWERGFLVDLTAKFRQFGLATRLSLAQVLTMQRCMTKAVLNG